MEKKKASASTRREFIRRATTAAGSLSSMAFMEPKLAFGSQANSKIQVGIIGTGGRGRYDGKNLIATGHAQIVALADYFDFQMKEPAEQFGVDSSRCFSGLDGYKQLLELPSIDAVILTTPPYFRPEQFRLAVDSGKHVFAEKPIAVDAWGCRHFLETGKDAQKKHLTVVAGLQSRYEPTRKKIATLIQQGAIGRPLVGHSQRMGGDLWRRERPASFSERDHQIRHWLYYLWASGDFIVEMHIHNLDIFNWFTGLLPVSACGTGGRDVRTDVGDIYDHLNVLYDYRGSFHLSHTGTQIPTGYTGQESRIIGSEGSYDAVKGLFTKQEERIEHGNTRGASEEEMRQFVASVTGNGPYLNNSDYVTTSTFTSVLGRTAAYRRQKVTWNELWNTPERISMPV